MFFKSKTDDPLSRAKRLFESLKEKKEIGYPIYRVRRQLATSLDSEDLVNYQTTDFSEFLNELQGLKEAESSCVSNMFNLFEQSKSVAIGTLTLFLDKYVEQYAKIDREISQRMKEITDSSLTNKTELLMEASTLLYNAQLFVIDMKIELQKQLDAIAAIHAEPAQGLVPYSSLSLS